MDCSPGRRCSLQRRRCGGLDVTLIHSPTKNFQAGLPEKFGSGNGANARQNFTLKPVFLEIAHFNPERTVLFSGWRNCAKKVKIWSMSGKLPRTGAHSGRKKGVFPRV